MSNYKAFRINIKNLHFVLLEKDNLDGIVYDEKIDSVPGLMSIQIAPQIASGGLFGDGVQRAQADKITSCQITLEHNKIDYSLLAKYSGSQITDGVMRFSSDDKPPYFAMGYEVETDSGHKELIWFLKCKLAPGERAAQQSTDAVEYSTDNYTITALPSDYNKDIYYIGDTSDEEMGFTEEQAAKWFEKVIVLPPAGSKPQEA